MVLFLQRQNEQKAREMSELVKEMEEIKKRNDDLRSTVQQKEQENDGLKVCFQSAGGSRCCGFRVQN